MSSSTYKRLNISDSFVVPYTANKTWEIPSESFDANRVLWNVGVNYGTSSIFNPESDFFTNNQYDRLVYNSINLLYYPNFLPSSSIITSSKMLSEFNDGTLTTSSYYNGHIDLGNLDTYKWYPTTSGSVVWVLNMPKTLTGDKILPKSFELVFKIPDYDGSVETYLKYAEAVGLTVDTDGDGIVDTFIGNAGSTSQSPFFTEDGINYVYGYIRDDGNYNLYYDGNSLSRLFPIFQTIPSSIGTDLQQGDYVGNIFYEQNIAILTIVPNAIRTIGWRPIDPICEWITPSKSVTPTPTNTRTPSVTVSKTPTKTPSVTPTPTRTPSVTTSAPVGPSQSPSTTPSTSIFPSFSNTPTQTPTPTNTPSVTPSGEPPVVITGFGGGCGGGNCLQGLIIVPDAAPNGTGNALHLNGAFKFDMTLCGNNTGIQVYRDGGGTGGNGNIPALIINPTVQLGLPVNVNNINANPFDPDNPQITNGAAYPICRCDTQSPGGWYYQNTVGFVANQSGIISDPNGWSVGLTYRSSWPAWMTANTFLLDAYDCASPCREFIIFVESGQSPTTYSYTNSSGAPATVTVPVPAGGSVSSQTITSRTLPVRMSGSGFIYFTGISRCS